MKKILTCFLLFYSITVLGQIQLDTLNIDYSRIEDPIGYIKKESTNGKLDFNKTLESEKKKFYNYNFALYNKKNYAIVLWGKAVRLIGITNFPEAVQLWEEINNREIRSKERTSLWLGFEDVIII